MSRTFRAVTSNARHSLYGLFLYCYEYRTCDLFFLQNTYFLKKAVFLPLHCILEAEGRSSDGPTHADGRAALAVGPPELPAAPTQRPRVIRQRFSTFSAAVAAGFSC